MSTPEGFSDPQPEPGPFMAMLDDLETRATATPGIQRDFTNGFIGSLASLLAQTPEGRAMWRTALDHTAAQMARTQR